MSHMWTKQLVFFFFFFCLGGGVYIPIYPPSLRPWYQVRWLSGWRWVEWLRCVWSERSIAVRRWRRERRQRGRAETTARQARPLRRGRTGRSGSVPIHSPRLTSSQPTSPSAPRLVNGRSVRLEVTQFDVAATNQSVLSSNVIVRSQ